MAKKQFLASLELKILSALDSITSGFIGLGAKSDGLYYKDGTNEGKIWHSANDGSGSGLDADKLDGQEASYFQQAISVNAKRLLGRYSATSGAIEEIQIGTGLSLVDDILKVSSSYTHPSGFGDQPATPLINGDVINLIKVNAEGHVTGVSVRQLTYADVNAQEEIVMRPYSLLGNGTANDQVPVMNVSLGSGLAFNANGELYITSGGGSGTVTSVGLSMPDMFTVTPSSITTSGVFTVALAKQGMGAFFAGPASGVASGVPQWRTIQAVDLPALPYDNYYSFKCGIVGDTISDIMGTQYGSGFNGVTFEAGTGIELLGMGGVDGSLKIKISSTGGSGGGINNISGNTYLTSNVTLNTSSYVSIRGITLPSAGTYLVIFSGAMYYSGTGYTSALMRMYGGSTTYASGVSSNVTNASYHQFNFHAIITVGASTVIYVQGKGMASNISFYANCGEGSSTATSLSYIKLA